MAEPHWTNYAYITAGIISSLAVIFGVIHGFFSNRKKNALKSHELRLELRKAINKAESDVIQLQDFIADVDQSRKKVAAAIGIALSSNMEKWKQQVEEDRKKVASIKADIPDETKATDIKDHKELESILGQVDMLQKKLDTIREEYERAIREDDERRREIRKNARTANLERKATLKDC